MTKLSYAFIPLFALLAIAPAGAATKKATAKTVETIKCEEFVTLDEEYKPHVIAYALGYDRAKHPEEEVVDVAGVEKIVPVIVASCQSRPSETLLQRIRADLKKL